ncbi:ferredoxin--nitrite reductase [Aerosakkonemataceae cyanobacterium BLCC-F50]|uniref:Ferredoxin--nitrite reductase n=1 Tax=Floridaenema flaviceps BLCC-F50 TaxID=3153642 RepID=A0ABV4XKL7_9CYAN
MTSTVTPPTTSTQNKFEKFKAEKDGLAVKEQLEEFARIGWEAMDETDREHRLKWLGIFFRPVTPGKFMMRLRLPNGIINSDQMRVLGEIVQRYGSDGNADITTRQNLQLRGIRIEDVPDIFRKMKAVGLTSVQSGMDNVRNITGSPVAGIDGDELFDTRELCFQVQDMITNHGEGNSEFTNLPRKFNIAIAGCRDNSIHAEINDIAFIPAFLNETFGFNVLVGGFFSAKRCDAAIPLNAWVPPSDVVALCRAILELFRDKGLRANRQKARLMWLIDEMGLGQFRTEVVNRMGKPLAEAAAKDEIEWEKRDHIGVYKQKQPGLNFVGLHIPIGRLFAPDMFEIARVADVYGNGEIRLTVEENLLIPNIPDDKLEAFLAEPILQKFSIDPTPLNRALVSCTGAQFCGFALIETKNRALAMIKELDAELTLTKPVRIHWTGCPNSCGQPQVADIGLMGTKVRKDGKTVEGVDLYMGGKVGKDAHLGTCVRKGIPCADLKPLLREILSEKFAAIPKEGIATTTEHSAEIEVKEQKVTITFDEETDAQGVKVPKVKRSEPVQPTVISFAKSGKEVNASSEQFILEVAEAEGVEIPSSCRSGNCGTCKQKLLLGGVEYEGEPNALSDSEKEQGFILTCISHPVGRVVIDA